MDIKMKKKLMISFNIYGKIDFKTDAIHFSVRLRTGSNPANINRFLATLKITFYDNTNTINAITEQRLNRNLLI